MVRRPALASVLGGLSWIAAAVHAVVAAVSFRLVTTMDLLFKEALVEDRVFPYTGEAEEQAILPGMVFFLSVLGTLLTVGAAVLLRWASRDGWRVVWVVLVVVELVLPALLIDVPVVRLAMLTAEDEVSRQLYSRWYVPLLVAGAWLHVALLITGVLTSLWQVRRRARRPAME
jgi:hypothetical protein